MNIKPYKNSFLSKKFQIQQMFDKISSRYDFINHILSFGIDIKWRKKLVYYLTKYSPNYILDLATGTGDLAILSAQKILNSHVIGIDFSKKMLNLAIKKSIKKKINNRINFFYGDSEFIPFNDGYFDAITVSFGIRNFENLSISLLEMNRVLKFSGYLLILEFSNPINFPVKQLYYFYNQYFLPFIGKILSKDKFAYKYLPKSTKNFPYGEKMKKILIKVGFCNIQLIPMTFGIVTIYIAKKIKNY